MSKATKKKHVTKEIEGEFTVPLEDQSIVRIMESRGNNLHQVEDASGEKYLVSMPSKYRRNIWVKNGNFVVVEQIEEGDKVKAEIVKILTREHIKYYRKQNCWPMAFDSSDSTATTDDDTLFVNTNRLQRKEDVESESDSESQSDSDA